MIGDVLSVEVAGSKKYGPLKWGEAFHLFSEGILGGDHHLAARPEIFFELDAGGVVGPFAFRRAGLRLLPMSTLVLVWADGPSVTDCHEDLSGFRIATCDIIQVCDALEGLARRAFPGITIVEFQGSSRLHLIPTREGGLRAVVHGCLINDPYNQLSRLRIISGSEIPRD